MVVTERSRTRGRKDDGGGRSGWSGGEGRIIGGAVGDNMKELKTGDII